MPFTLWREFMWMYRVRPEGQAIEAYKHRATRRYLHLDHEGRAWHWTRDGTWTLTPVASALSSAIEDREHLRPRGVDPIQRRASGRRP